MPAELRHLRRRLDWLEAFASVLDSQLRAQAPPRAPPGSVRADCAQRQGEQDPRRDGTDGRASTRSRDCCMSSWLARKPRPPNSPTWRDSSADLPKNAQREVHHDH
jgi:hypothetical protein